MRIAYETFILDYACFHLLQTSRTCVDSGPNRLRNPVCQPVMRPSEQSLWLVISLI